MSRVTLHFLGGTDTVTGSKFLVQTDRQRVLVDCGLFQGLEAVEERNRDEPVVDPAKLDAVLITHGHLDHVGALPLYYRHGFRGPVLGTGPTLSTARIILRDSASIQERKAHEASRQRPGDESVEPLYTSEDAEQVIDHFERRVENTWHQVTPSISYRHRRAGHILGATFLELNVAGRKLTFSGDLGRPDHPLIPAPESPRSTEFLVMESTYGNRNHVHYRLRTLVRRYICRAIEQQGTVLIPSFAVERTQHVMWILHQLRQEGRIPDVPMYLDTPMGIDVCGLLYEYPEWHRLYLKEWREAFDAFTAVESGENSRSIVEAREPKIVIAGSGMVSGGRILSYLKKHLTDPDSVLMLVGYQAEGTHGRTLQEGADVLRFHGTNVPVRIPVRTIPGLSAHADQGELLYWCRRMEEPPERTFLVHGNKPSRNTLQRAINRVPSFRCLTPTQNDSIQLT